VYRQPKLAHPRIRISVSAARQINAAALAITQQFGCSRSFAYAVAAAKGFGVKLTDEEMWDSLISRPRPFRPDRARRRKAKQKKGGRK
jgi:hypothetical protein